MCYFFVVGREVASSFRAKRMLQVSYCVVAMSSCAVFRAFVAEGLAPELFFAWWLQGFFRGCVLNEGDLLRIWDALPVRPSTCPPH